MTKMDKLQQEIEEKRSQLQKLQDEQKNIQLSGPEYVLAVELHEKLCHWNHADGCGWYYEIHDGVHDWNGSAHKSYLRKAQTIFITTGMDLDDVLRVIEHL